MAKTAVKQIWRHPETRKAFVYFTDADTGAALNSLDGYSISEAGSNINAPAGTTQPTQPTQPVQQAAPAAAPAQEQPPVNTPLTASEARGGGENISVDRKAKAAEMLAMPGAVQDEATGIIKVPTPSSGGFMSYDPNTGWSAYTNKDGITTTFDAQGNILGGPGLAPQLGTKSGAFLGEGIESIKGTGVLGAILGALLNPVGTITKAIVDRIMGQEGIKNADGSVTYTDINKEVSSPVGGATQQGFPDQVDASYMAPASQQQVETGKGFVSGTSPAAQSGNFSQSIRSFGDDAIIEGNTTPQGATSRGFLGGVSQSFTSPTQKDVATQNVVGVVEAGNGFTTVQFADGTIETRSGTRGARNNNPGNIEYGNFAKSMGAIGTDGRFAVFSTPEDGKKAMEALITGPAYGNLTIGQAIAKYAPPFENDTKAYANTVAKATGVNVNTPISSLSPEQLSSLIDSMIEVEGTNKGYSVTNSNRTQNITNQSNNPLMGKFDSINPTPSLASQRGMTGINEDNITNRSIEARTEEEDKDSTNRSIESLPAGILSDQNNFYGQPIGAGATGSAVGNFGISAKNDFSSRSVTGNVSPTAKASGFATYSPTSFDITSAPISMPADSFLGLGGIAIDNRNPTAISNLGLSPNPVSVSTFTPQPASTVPQGFFGQEGGIPQQKDKSWQQSVVDMITPTIAPAIGWAIGKALENYGPQKEQTPLGSIADPRGSLTTQPSFVSSSPTQQGPVPYGMEESYLDYLAEKENENRSKLAPNITQNLTSNVDQGRSVFSNISDLAQTSFATSQAEQAAERQAAQIAAQVAAQAAERQAAQIAAQMAQAEQAAERQAAQAAAQASAAYSGGGSGVSVSTAGPSGSPSSGVYSGPSGWESSGGGVWDSLGSGSAIDYGGGDSYGGWSGSASSGVGTAGSAVGSAGSSGVGTAGSVSGNSGLSGAASGVGTAGGSSGGFNSAPGSTSGGYGGYGGWSGDGGWW